MLHDNFTINLFVGYSVVLSDSTSVDVDTIDVGTGGTMFWFYDAYRDDVRQGGILFTTWNGSGSVASVEQFPIEAGGDTSDLVFTTVSEGGNIILRAISINNWTIRYKKLIM